LIQSGQRDHEWMVDRCRALNAKTWVRRFIPNMGDAYELADLVVGRAGAMTISEATACGLPSILVPYPYATGNHQKLNAELLEDVGAAIVISEDRLTGAFLAERIDELLHDPRLLRQMALSSHRMARPEATDRIAAALVRYLPGVEIPEPAFAERGGRGGNGPRQAGDRREGGYRADFARGRSDRGQPRAGTGRDRDRSGGTGRRDDQRRPGSPGDDRIRRESPSGSTGLVAPGTDVRRSSGRGGQRRGGPRGGTGGATGGSAGGSIAGANRSAGTAGGDGV
jgi:hypothetical protein